MKNTAKIASGFIGLYLILTPCLALGHHSEYDVESDVSTQHMHHDLEHTKSDTNCDIECCNDDFISMPSSGKEIKVAHSIFQDSSFSGLVVTLVHAQRGHKALARAGPLFEQAKKHATTTVIRV